MGYTDQQLRDAVDAVFGQFDKDGSNCLDQNEVYNLINAAMSHMGEGKQVSQGEVQQFIQAVDKSGDGKIQKPELFQIFRKILPQWLWSNLISENFTIFLDNCNSVNAAVEFSITFFKANFKKKF